MLTQLPCPVCRKNSIPHDVVDFNRSCEELKGKFLGLSGIPVYYYLCGNCGFCFAPEFRNWQLSDFETKIYNDTYIEVDPEYEKLRPEKHAQIINNTFQAQKPHLRHLDFGGGNGLLSTLLKNAGWDSSSYDPFADPDVDITELGSFNLVTAFEVFEHVPDVHALMSQLQHLLHDNGLILFTTALSDGKIIANKRLDWWYAAPRNGHISLFSKNSLVLLAQQYGFTVAGLQSNFYLLFRQLPEWASHLFNKKS